MMLSKPERHSLLANTAGLPDESFSQSTLPITDESLEGLLGDPAYSRVLPTIHTQTSPPELTNRASTLILSPLNSQSTSYPSPNMPSPVVEPQSIKLNQITSILLANDSTLSENTKKLKDVMEGMEELETEQRLLSGKVGEVLERMYTVENAGAVTDGLSLVQDSVAQLQVDLGAVNVQVEALERGQKGLEEGIVDRLAGLEASVDDRVRSLTEKMASLEEKIQHFLNNTRNEEQDAQRETKMVTVDSKLDALLAMVSTLHNTQPPLTSTTGIPSPPITTPTSEAGPSRMAPHVEESDAQASSGIATLPGDWTLPETDNASISDNDDDTLEQYFDPTGGVSMQDVLPRPITVMEMQGEMQGESQGEQAGEEGRPGDRVDEEISEAQDDESAEGAEAGVGMALEAEVGEPSMDTAKGGVAELASENDADAYRDNGSAEQGAIEADVQVDEFNKVQSETGSTAEEDAGKMDQLVEPENDDAESKHESSGSNTSDVLQTPHIKDRAGPSVHSTSRSPSPLVQPRRRFPLRRSTVNYAVDPLMDYQKQLKRRASNVDKDDVDTRSLKRSTSMSVKSEKGRQRESKGPHARLPSRALGASNGMRRGQGKWPKRGENTIKGQVVSVRERVWIRLIARHPQQDIQCEQCKGNVHWACAGLMDDDNAPEDDWLCPDCYTAIRAGTPKRTVAIAPPLLCVRPDCIKRLKQRIIRKDGDDDEYVVEKIIGRRATGRNPDTSRIFEHLVKWVGWDVQNCTWEPEEHLKFQAKEIGDFVRECAEKTLDTRKRVTLLPEAKTAWDDDGELKE